MPLVTAEPYQQEGIAGWLSMRIDKPSVMVVAVDTEHRIYGYTQQEIAENFPKLYVSVVFKPWKEGTEYKDGNWIFRNQFYVPPTYLDCYIAPSVQAEEDGETTEPSKLKAYAYAVDTTAWRIASYIDAAAGVITSKNDPSQTRSNPNFTASKRGVGRLRHGSEQPDADGGRGRPDQRGLRLFETGGRPRRRARDLPDCLPHMAPRIPLCRGRLARGQ
ncbi:MAG: hypothetical protein ACLUFW_01620 [Alistipes sp.]